MASNLVNLDAIIRREDWQAKPDEANSGMLQTPTGITFKAIEFEKTGLAFQLLRKPEFQRETASWDPKKVVDLVKCFLEGDLIPSVIIWKNNESGNLFVIDGAHRLGALIAWVHDDYGDGDLSREFFNKIIPPEQQKAADDTRIEMIKEVGLYKTIKQSGNLPNTVKEGKYARTLLMRSVVVQEINGGFDKAEASFFKINQKAAPISPTELQLIESRDKAYGIATRALVRAGVGHKYWKKFPPETQVQIENLAQETYSLLFKPPLSSPISVGLDLPIGGRGYSTEAISLLLALVNLTIYPPKKKSRGMKNVDGIKAPQIPDDKDGKETIVLLQDVKRIITRVAGKALRSLALHSAVYFYSASGRFQPSAFLAVASLIKELEDENGKPFLWFSIHRAHFESYLARHRFLVNQMVIKHGSMEKSHEPILAMIRAMLLLSSERKTDPEIMEGLKKQFDYLYPQEATDFPGTQSEFSTAVKNAKLRKAGLEKVHSCHICGAAIHPNAISMEHYVDKKHGGTSNLANAEFSHPYCNSEKDALQAIFKSSDPEAWSSVPTPKVLCQQPLPNPPEGSIQTESPAPV